MTDEQRRQFLNRWILLIFPSYLRYIHQLERNSLWMDRFPARAREITVQVLAEQTEYCQQLADRLDDLDAEPELALFPEDASRLNYLEMSVAVKRSIERIEYNLEQLGADRQAVTSDPELAQTLAEGIEMLQRHVTELAPHASESSPSG